MRKYLKKVIMISLVISLLCPVTVSYTHLDVYKRQDAG